MAHPWCQNNRLATVTVPQGVGDCFWVYQLVAPHFGRIKFRVVTIGDQRMDIQHRARAALAALPGVEGVDFAPVAGEAFAKFVSVKMTVRGTVGSALTDPAAPDVEFAFQANRQLEAGVRLEDVDPGLPVARDVAVPWRPVAGAAAGGYLLVYVSGDTVRHQHVGTCWAVDQWAEYVDRLCYNQGVGTSVPVHVLGAGYDEAAVVALDAALRRAGFHTVAHLDRPVDQVHWLLGNAWFFAGYQSGLSVLADNVNANQLIVYYDTIAPMGDSWVKPANRRTLFNVATFADAPAAVALRTAVARRPVVS